MTTQQLIEQIKIKEIISRRGMLIWIKSNTFIRTRRSYFRIQAIIDATRFMRCLQYVLSLKPMESRMDGFTKLSITSTI
jgi:hypothetical protein